MWGDAKTLKELFVSWVSVVITCLTVFVGVILIVATLAWGVSRLEDFATSTVKERIAKAYKEGYADGGYAGWKEASQMYIP